MKKILSDKSGGTYVRAATSVMFLAIILSAVLFFAQSMSLASDIKSRVRLTLDSFIIKKSIDIYAVIDDGEDFTSLEDQLAFDEYFFSQFSGLTYDKSSSTADAAVYSSDGSYSLTVPTLSLNGDGRLRLYADFTLIIPVYFFETKLFDMVIPMRVSSGLTRIC